MYIANRRYCLLSPLLLFLAFSSAINFFIVLLNAVIPIVWITSRSAVITSFPAYPILLQMQQQIRPAPTIRHCATRRLGALSNARLLSMLCGLFPDFPIFPEPRRRRCHKTTAFSERRQLTNQPRRLVALFPGSGSVVTGATLPLFTP